jgi:hypothetical protein
MTTPVLHRPDSVTHWTCDASEDGDTHHIGATSVCVYCKKPVGQLRVEQAAILREGVKS